MFDIESVALKKSKSLCFGSKEKFLKSEGVNSNDENMMKSNDGIPSRHGSENEGMCFLCYSLKKTRNSYFCVTPKNHRLMFVLKKLKSTVTKIVIVCFYNLAEENFCSSFCNISNFSNGFV